MAKYLVLRGLKWEEIDCDCVAVDDEKGTKVELSYRKLDQEISVSANGSVVIRPIASNVFRVSKEK